MATSTATDQPLVNIYCEKCVPKRSMALRQFHFEVGKDGFILQFAKEDLADLSNLGLGAFCPHLNINILAEKLQCEVDQCVEHLLDMGDA